MDDWDSDEQAGGNEKDYIQDQDYLRFMLTCFHLDTSIEPGKGTLGALARRAKSHGTNRARIIERGKREHRAPWVCCSHGQKSDAGYSDSLSMGWDRRLSMVTLGFA